METWFIILISLCISALLRALFNLIVSPSSSSSSSSSSSHKKLPPGPTVVPVIGNFIWLRKSFSEIEPVLRDLRSKYGPIITLRMGSRPAIFVASHSIAHRALVQNGAVFSDRPKSATGQVINSNQHNISSAAYGPTWRLLRRNLTSEILHPSRVKSYSRARRWVLGILMDRLVVEASRSTSPVKVVDHFQYAMFCLLVLMCFGDRLEEKQIKDVERVQRQLLLSFGRFNILNFWPRIGKMVFRKRWKELMCLRQNQEDVLIPLIRARMEVVKQKRQQLIKKGNKQNYSKEEEEEESEERMAYVDTLFDLELPDEKRKPNDGELVTLCGEFLNAGTDTTSTALQWIMANLVKYPRVQAKLYQEIAGVMGPPRPTLNKEQVEGGGGGKRSKYDKEIMMSGAAIGEEDLQRMPYLKAVVLEGLRRHPPGHFVLPHVVTEDVELEGYLVPKNATVNFMVADMGWDPKVWEEPMEFKPERFLINGNNNNSKIDDDDDGGKLGGGGGGEALFDLTGSREIKMMPFGAGRRICPGSGLALLHLEYFVANLVWYFEWTAAVGDDLDLAEKQEFTIVMKNPLRAHISPRAAA